MALTAPFGQVAPQSRERFKARSQCSEAQTDVGNFFQVQRHEWRWWTFGASRRRAVHTLADSMSFDCVR